MIEEFAVRRARLAELIGEGGLVLVPAAIESIRNHDVTHHFRQDSDFFYLTGFPEPEAVMALAPGHPAGEFVLFVRPRDRELETWSGYRAGVEGAKGRYRADAAFPLSELSAQLVELASGRDTLFVRHGSVSLDAAVAGLAGKLRSLHHRYGRPVPLVTADLGPIIGEMRIRKSQAEIESLRRACHLSAEGHLEAMRMARPSLFEYQVQAVMEYRWRLAGSPRNGYDSIVASGPNACVLHYVENHRLLGEGDLLLIDAGAEVDYLSADITRTFPVSKRFSGPQRAVYEVVLLAARAALDTCKPGATIRDPHDASVRTITDGLTDLGLLPRRIDDSLSMHHYREFFMHGTSHWLGMDVHDAGAYRLRGAHRVLEPAMAFTIEPGVYIAADRAEIDFPLLEYDLDEWQERRIRLGTVEARRLERDAQAAAPSVRHRIPEALLGIGVRIEDDVLITPDSYDNLSASVPTDPDAVEGVCSEAPSTI